MGYYARVSSPLIGQRVSHYRILDLLGKGGMGEVYVAQDETLDRKVALKRLRSEGHADAESRLRFMREARALSQLSNPHICQIFDYIEAGDSRFLVLELISGQSLSRALRKGLSPRQKLQVASQIATALSAAHEKGIIHRDLKPDNVMITPEGQAKVLDFGLSRLQDEEDTVLLHPAKQGPAGAADPPADSDETWAAPRRTPRPAPEEAGVSRPSLTTHGEIMGTLSYMSPEQARGEQVAASTDLYSFGLLLQELFTGQPPYEKGLDPVVLLERVRAGRTLPVQGLDPDLAALIQRLKALSPPARPSAADAADRIAWIQERPRRRRRKALVALSMAALALFGAAMTVQTLRAERAGRAAREQAATARQVSDFLVGLFKVSDPDKEEGRTVTARELLDRGARQVEQNLGTQPKVQARLMDTMGRVYTKLGLYPEARDLLAKALAIREKVLGPRDLELADNLRDMALVEDDLGQFPEAEQDYLRSAHIRETAMGPDDPDLSKVLGDLAIFYSEEGKNAQAEALFRRALAIREKAFGPETPQVARSMDNLATLLGEEKRYPEAEALHQRSLAIFEKTLGPGHPDVARCLENCGADLLDQGRFREAEPYFRQSLAIFEKALGPDHPDVAGDLRNLAAVLEKEGRLAEAAALLQRSLGIYVKAQGPASRDASATRLDLARLQTLQGQRTKALRTLPGAGTRESVPPGSPGAGGR